MKKTAAIILSAFLCVSAAGIGAAAANGVTYTFSGNNVITDGSPNDITDVALTKDITVTTSGDMNRKYAAITDLAHNKDAGTFPVNNTFTASGSYIYLGCANVNDNAIITLNMPEIAAGSKVTLTFAKPVVTNNGSTLRNTNDPYAYLKIADRYISINGDNFDTWRMESVVTGESTNAIEFHADKWGAVCISKIEISAGDGKPLHDLNISSTQYANLVVNGIKFQADETGHITLPSYPEGETVTIKAYKDGYSEAETTAKITSGGADVNIPLTCETDAEYYESDFGDINGTLALDGEYKIGEGIDAREVTRVFGRVTFDKDGYADIISDCNIPVRISYDGENMSVNDTVIAEKDNMDFELFYDTKNGQVFLKQNDCLYCVNDAAKGGESVTVSRINAVSGKGAVLDYIGVSYPDPTKITIEGPDKIVPPVKTDTSFSNESDCTYTYTAVPEYTPYGTHVEFTTDSDIAKVLMPSHNRTPYPPFEGVCTVSPASGASGRMTLTVSYNGTTVQKEIEIVGNAKITDWNRNTVYLNLHGTDLAFDVYGVKTDGADMQMGSYMLKDFKSSDESVLKVTSTGRLAPVGSGKATITANAYTGIDNVVSVNYVVDGYYMDRVAEADVSYAENEIMPDEHITGYKVSWWNGSEDIELSDIPAYTVKEDGTVVTAYYLASGELRNVSSKKVKAGDKIAAANGTKKVYFCRDGSIEEIKDSDTTIEGFKVTCVPSGIWYQISPVYTYENIGNCADGVTLDGTFITDRYNITFKKGEAKRGDIFVNGFMAGNNVDQCDADRKLTEGSEYTVKDFYIGNSGKVTVSMTDGSTLMDSVSLTRSGLDTKPLIYIIGDSLACNYYGSYEKEVGGGRTGWGQVLDNYINADVVNLANSGQYAKGLYDTAFPSIVNNRPTYCLIECGYNDRSYSTREEMTACVKAMIKECRENDVVPILVTPNASEHDYKPSVSWSSYLIDAAVDENCLYIDLSKMSYDFLNSLYGDNADGVITKNYNLTEVGGDTLHSSYAAAQKWASMVAQGLKDMNLGWNNDDMFNTDYEYKFTDTLGNEITASVK